MGSKVEDKELEEVMIKVADDLIANNKPLDNDIAQLIDDNIMDLLT